MLGRIFSLILLPAIANLIKLPKCLLKLDDNRRKDNAASLKALEQKSADQRTDEPLTTSND